MSEGSTEQVVSYVRGLIERGRLRPGDQLPAERDLAHQVGVSRPTVSRLESAAQNTTLQTLDQIARALRCDVFELLKEPVGRRRG